jgi:hypothetical protein
LSGAFSKSKSQSQKRTTFDVTSTPFSTFSRGVRGGRLNLDPSIRGIQDRTLSGIQGSRGSFGAGADQVLQNFGQTRESLLGNQGLFRQARVDPLERRFAAGRGELQRGLGRRNISGSSFADNAVQGFDINAQREIGNASALADAETLQAVTGIDRDTLNALIGKVTIEAQMRGEDMQVARDRLQQELASFNFGRGGTATSKSSGFSAGLSTGTPAGT